jgi:RNA polymerase sigma-70 factor, ECF subfamily
MSSDDLTELLGAVATRDVAAFEQLYAATSAKLYGVVLRILRRHDLAAAVLEDAYLQIRDRAAIYNGSLGSPMIWMLAIARRLAIDAARRPGAVPENAEPEIADAERPGPLPRREMTENLKRLLTCIGRLEPDRQRMLLLAYYGAFSRVELAQKLDTSASEVRASLQRSLAEIDQCLNS